MTDRQVWLITGAGRGLGVDIAKAALAAGHAVVATGRDPAKGIAAIGKHAKLPLMRKQRSGLLLTISSTAGISGGMFCTAYAAAKFGIEGWMESLTPEIAPFGIRTMLVEPGFFRTELLTLGSTTYAKPSINDYAERTRETVAAWGSMDGKQGGDPARLADALVQLAGLEEPPARFAAGVDAVQTFEAKAKTLLVQADAHRALSSSLSHDDA